MRAVKIIVSGAVQGVFFRHETRGLARELGLKGWVKNLADGTVEIVAEGEEPSIQKIIQFSREGPQGASVTGIGVTEFDGEAGMFEIRY